MCDNSGLGFYDLMNIAEQNAEQTAKTTKNLKFPSFNAPKPKKLDPKQKVLSNNVQKFLAKKQEEEKRNLEEARKKKQRLLELRSQDKKATKRVGQMLRMTKSANKSVIDEAKHCLEDSLAEQDGYQPDEDDYGYVSQHAAEYHRKMMEKYRSIPVSKPPPKSKHQGVPLPEVQSLKKTKIREDEGHVAPRQSNHDVDSMSNASGKSNKKPQPKKVAPPPLNFNALLELAEEKCKEPVILKRPVKDPEAEEKYEFGRPMTKKEKEKYLQEKAIREKINRGDFNGVRKNEDLTNQPSTSKSFKIPNKNAKAVPTHSSLKTTTAIPSGSGTTTMGKSNDKNKPAIPTVASKFNNTVTPTKSVSQPTSSTSMTPPKKDVIPPVHKKAPQPAKSMGNHSSSSSSAKPSSSKEPRPGPSPNSYSQTKSKLTKPTSSVPEKLSHDRTKARPSSPPVYSNSKRRPDRSRSPPAYSNSKRRPDRSRSPPAYSNSKRREDRSRSPPAYSNSKRRPDRSRSPPAFSNSKRRPDRSRSPPPRSKPSLKHHQVIDSEDEYDSEMDDFIDDSDLGASQISDLIRNITGYDKRRYNDVSDDECMESSVWQQMKEEQRSLRIGVQEDLEDIRKEQEELKRKELMRAKMKKRR